MSSVAAEESAQFDSQGKLQECVRHEGERPARCTGPNEAPSDPGTRQSDRGGLEGYPTLREVKLSFLEGSGFRGEDVQALNERLSRSLEPTPESVRRSDGDIGPMTKAVLAIDAMEDAIPHARYRLQYGVVDVHAPPAGYTTPVSVIRIDRFNLGPRLHARLAEALMPDEPPPAEIFGVGPHVAYRLVTRPVMGQAAAIAGASRKEIAPEVADDLDCLGTPCTSVDPGAENAVSWRDEASLAVDLDRPYRVTSTRDGVLTPAAVTDVLMIVANFASLHGSTPRWHGPEPREGVAPGEPFIEVVLELRPGTEASKTDGYMRDGHVMDHVIEAAWHRVQALSRGKEQPPALTHASAYEYREPPH